VFFKRPTISEYILARLVTVLVLLVVIFGLFLILSFGFQKIVILTIIATIVALGIFVVIVYRGAKKIERELSTINLYLANIEEIDSVDYETNFFAKEFEQINQNLIKVLKKAKKREEIKQRYNAKLKLKNSQRSDMISALAHEFRNPIAAIMGYAQTLIEDHEIPPKLQEKFLTKIYNNGQTIESLLARLILWNKFESKEAQLHLSSVDLYALAQGVITSLKEKYKEREIILEGEETIASIDRTLMEIVLKNLIENGLKYSKDEVRVKIGKSGIFIEDKGVGIPQEHIDKVTKKFYRSREHSWDNSMGLGLSIVKTILAMHNTQLHIQSVPNEGSVFSFVLPL